MVIQDLLNLWDRHETVRILSHYMMTTTGYIYAHQDEPVMHKIQELALRAISLRKEGYPLQYILGTWDFYSLELKVHEGVLIPRPETELLVETAIEIAKANEWKAPVILDVGFGSGAIALAVQKHIPSATVVGTDISRCALIIAEENARDLGLERVRFLEGDLFSAVQGKCFDIILSNPPYLTTEEMDHVQKELTFEPPLALHAGSSGMDVYERLIPEAIRHLHPGGYLLLEIGATQGDEVSTLLHKWGYRDIVVQPDLSGHDRMVLARSGGLS